MNTETLLLVYGMIIKQIISFVNDVAEVSEQHVNNLEKKDLDAITLEKELERIKNVEIGIKFTYFIVKMLMANFNEIENVLKNEKKSNLKGTN